MLAQLRWQKMSISRLTIFQSLVLFCLENGIDLVVVGPEGPLVRGIRDYFENDHSLRNLLLVGPGKQGAQLEGSKDFSKQFMVRHGVPTANAKTFQVHELPEALNYLQTCETPIVLKADGLAAGKGVVIAATIKEARKFCVKCWRGKNSEKPVPRF